MSKGESKNLPFQSTSPVWRTTAMSVFILFIIVISIHVPRVEDDVEHITDFEMPEISIHVPRVEDDGCSKSR